MKKTLLTIVLAVLCLDFSARAQQPAKQSSVKQTFTGKIITSSNNEPLRGATIKINPLNRSITTNDRGEFTLNLPNGNYNLSIHYLAYKTITLDIKIPLDSLLIISLDADEQNLQEIEINAGYYTVKDRERTGSISKITSKEIERQPVNNVLQAMQANITGVQITQNTGVPGGGFNVQIRGQNSIQQGNSPFYIIDGVPFTATTMAGSRSQFITPDPSPLASINPSDIESIEVLKDADATAIYGSRGANGVILITTKKGTSGQPTASFSAVQGFSTVAKKLDLMNTTQYLQMRNEAFSNDKLTPGSNQYDVNGTWSADRNIDWQEQLIGGIAPSTNVQSSFMGNAGNVQYRLGGAYYNEGTVFPGNQQFRRGSADFSLRYTSRNEKLALNASANYSSIKSQLFGTDLTAYILLPPNYPDLLDAQGNINWENNTVYINPLAVTERTFLAKTNNLIGNITADYRILTDLQFKVSLGYTTMNRDDFNSSPLSSQSPATATYGPESRISYFGNNSIVTWIAEPQLNWKKQFGKNRLDLLVGTTFQQNLTDGQNVKATGYNSDALMGNIASASLLSIQERQYLQYRYTALFTRLNYGINGRYFINLTARRDGSSRFGKENRFANFGAIGAAWVISGEGFFNKLPFISFAKLRASYGITGNDQLADYGYLELWTTYFNTYQGISTVSPNQIANPSYAWEINKKKEFALDLAFFNDRITFSSVFYYNRSDSQLIRRQLAPSTGFSSIQDNLPAIISNRGWEFELMVRNVAKPKFTWTTSFNLTIPRTKLVDYPGLATSSDAINYELGQPLSILKLYNTTVDLITGLYTSEDHDANGVIDNNDRYIIEEIGRKYYGGLQNSIQFKRFQFYFLFQFVKQQGNSYIRAFTSPGRFVVSSPTSNQPVQVLDRWTPNGDAVRYQRYGTTSQVNSGFVTASGQGNLTIDDSSFIRLKTAQLAYNLASSLLNKVSVDACQIFFQGQNLLTFTHFKGLDPEIQNVSNLPALRVLNAGIKVTF